MTDRYAAAATAAAWRRRTRRASAAMAKNGFLPPSFARVHGRSGIPRRALVINFVYALPSVSAVVFARGHAFPGGVPRWLLAIAPVAFVLATLIIYWAGWHELRIALPILLVYAYQHWRSGAPWADARLGMWLVAYLALVLLVSGIGSADFGGTNWIPAPWDSVVVAVIALAAWLAGVRNGMRHLAEHPAPEPAPEAAPDREPPAY